MKNSFSSLTFPVLSPAASAALNEEFNKSGINPTLALSALSAAASGIPPTPAANISDTIPSNEIEDNSNLLKEILEAIKKTIPKIQDEYNKESNRRDVGFKWIIRILIFAVCCIAIALALDITGIFAVSKGITAANAIVSLPAGVGLAVYAFQSKDKIENLRRDLILLYQIEGARKTPSKD